ncbi:multicopper oxidase-domain-containing protein [Sordaria brevicollis]|uniref:Multicopper oxidase-domain-containing protein n=1 Tax=Sordaria brevicollis TaxID=83679 RepID=A0AAE0UEZ8_SORBR|nr:multicopper oxidase-domain-containing protein [Sordaria brevicollis]
MFPRGTLSLIFIASHFLGSVLALTAVHDYSFIPDHHLRVSIRKVNFGCETRESLVINGTSPGPAIRLLPGARTWIRVYNDLQDQNLTMHWHGVTQRMAPFADGTPQASQWPIPPGHFFDYEVRTESRDAGTYFYHSHVGMQATTCSGPLIVDDCGSCPFDYDDERILYFQDYHRASDQKMVEDVEHVPYKWPGETDGIIVNGRSVPRKQKPTDDAIAERGVFGGGHASSPEGHPSPGAKQIKNEKGCTLPVIDVEPGKTYRFRIVGATGLSLLSMAVEDHTGFTIIQADGLQYIHPVDTADLQLGPGQRFDVLFKTKTTDELAKDGNRTTYYLQYETRSRPKQLRGYVVIRYDYDVPVPGEPNVAPVALPTDPNDWLEYTFEPRRTDVVAPTAAEVTRRITLEVNQVQDNVTGRDIWHISGLTWTEDSYKTPLLVDIYQRGSEALPNYTKAKENKGWDPETGSFPIKIGEVIELVIQNTGTKSRNTGFVEAHPFHAHSQHVFDIGAGPGVYDADANNKKIEKLGYKPTLRDTTMLYRYEDKVSPGKAAGWRAWRLKATAPGVWMIHCHILAHMGMGMQAIFVVGDASDIMNIAPEDVAGYLEYGGSVYGNSTFAPSPNEFFSDATDECGAYYTSSGDDEKQWSSTTNSTSSYNESTSEDSKSTSSYGSSSQDEAETDDDSTTVCPNSTSSRNPRSLASAESEQDTEKNDSSAAKDNSVTASSPTADEDAEQNISPESEEVLEYNDVQVPSAPIAIPKPVYRHRHQRGRPDHSGYHSHRG